MHRAGLNVIDLPRVAADDVKADRHVSCGRCDGVRMPVRLTIGRQRHIERNIHRSGRTPAGAPAGITCPYLIAVGAVVFRRRGPAGIPIVLDVIPAAVVRLLLELIRSRAPTPDQLMDKNWDQSSLFATFLKSTPCPRFLDYGPTYGYVITILFNFVTRTPFPPTITPSISTSTDLSTVPGRPTCISDACTTPHAFSPSPTMME